MRRIIILSLFIVAGVFLISLSCQAATGITLNEAPEINIYPYEFDKLVLDFTINVDQSDSLNALTVANNGLARDGYEIINLVLWQDDGDGVFEGMGKDIFIKNAGFRSAYDHWFWKNLDVNITDSARFFVSLESNYNAYLNQDTNVEMKINKFKDQNADNVFDDGDAGIFLSSKTDLPSQDLVNVNNQFIRMRAGDGSAPKAVITNLNEGQTYDFTTFLIEGQAKDQGESGIEKIKIYVNGQSVGDAESVGSGYSTWKFNWQNIVLGNYKIEVWARDGFGNVAPVADVVNITVTKEIEVQVVSQQNSYSKLNIYPQIVDNEPVLGKSTVYIRDQNNLPIEGKTIALDHSDNVITGLLSSVSDANGQIQFSIECLGAGSESIVVSSDKKAISQLSFVCQVKGGDIEPGDLIKASGDAVYYYGSDLKRYVFPDLKTYQSWYGDDFSKVKVITGDELAAIKIGGNVTYKPGVRMIKIQSIPKVYAVDLGGVLRWIETEDVAVRLYGANWASLVQDLPDSFFVNYSLGASITNTGDFDPEAVMNSAQID